MCVFTQAVSSSSFSILFLFTKKFVTNLPDRLGALPRVCINILLVSTAKNDDFACFCCWQGKVISKIESDRLSVNPYAAGG